MSELGSNPPAAPTARKRRWLAPLLVASLAFNLVIVGTALSGHFWPGHSEHGRNQRSGDLVPRQFLHDLDEERREQLASVFRVKRPEFRQEYRARNAAAAALADALEREPFDRQAAQSAIAEHTLRSHGLVDLGAAVADEMIEALTAEERRALAEAIRHRLEQDRQRRELRKR